MPVVTMVPPSIARSSYTLILQSLTDIAGSLSLVSFESNVTFFNSKTRLVWVSVWRLLS